MYQLIENKIIDEQKIVKTTSPNKFEFVDGDRKTFLSELLFVVDDDEEEDGDDGVVFVVPPPIVNIFPNIK